MSDQALERILDDLEHLLQVDQLEPEALAQWQTRLDAALVAAERGPGWAGIVDRAHALSAKLDNRTAALVEQRDLIRKELNLQAQGSRALKGYRSR